MASRCGVCKLNEESVDHLFVECPLIKWLWKVILLNLDHKATVMKDLKGLVDFFAKTFKGKGLCPAIARLFFCADMYFLWEFKNNLIFNEEIIPKMQVLRNMEHTSQR